MKALKWLGFGLVYAALVTGCGDEGGENNEDAGVQDAGGSDTSVFDGFATTDTGESPEDTGPGEENFGDTCEGARDCDTGQCIQVSGVEEGFCSRFCAVDDDCPEEGWECLFFVNSGGDAASVCVPTELCIDEDGDTFGAGPGCAGPDCDDTLASVYLGADEICNGFDDDCDGAVDENAVGLNEECDTGFPGGCGVGRTTCSAGTTQCVSVTGASAELCDGLDNDCDGEIDEAEDGAPLAEACYAGPAGTNGVGECIGGMRICNDGAFGPCIGQILPSPVEVCNGVDDDCNDAIDDGNPGGGFPCDTGLPGACAEGATACTEGATACESTVTPGLQDETCNGIDDDCDGEIDEGALWAELGDGCVVGNGVCAAVGILICNPDDPTGPPVCSGTPGEGFDEVCNGLDDDCDGEVDEGATWSELGTGCTSGDGICERGGVLICDEDAPVGPPVCSATPGTATEEVCNGLDDDCNGLVDDDPLWEDRGDVCVVGTGTCESAGILRCNVSDRDGPLVCSATPGDESAEVCNGLDDDCDGEVDNLDSPRCPLQLGVCEGSRQICAGADGFLDCSTLNYGAAYEQTEISCDGLDNDCDGIIDDVDVDRDGHIAVACGGDDCDDFNPLAYPGASEVCGDAVDNDCDGEIDNRDDDEDGFVAVACGGDDCNDLSSAAAPGLSEVCGDGLDNDCDGSIDNRDDDGDSFLALACGGTDCNDDNPNMFPGNPEVCDSFDNDCNRIIDDKDSDGDGFIDDDPVCGGDDCNDSDGLINPAAVEICGSGVDESCTGFDNDRDVDGDGYIDNDPACGGNDCDDTLATINPDASEIRDGRDNDCNDLFDEGVMSAGELVITEFLANPDAVGDTEGEWIEVYNASSTMINLNSMVLRDAGSDRAQMFGDEGLARVAPGEFGVICRNLDSRLNGGVNCNISYGDVFLSNGTDEIIIEIEGTQIDRVNYTSSYVHSGGSHSVRPGSYSASSNDSSSNWCVSGGTFGAGDSGTPGEDNICR